MATAWELIKFPFRALLRLVKVLALPALISVAAWWLLGMDSPVFVGIALLCGVWVLVMAHLWWLQVKGRLRSLARGAVRVSGQGGGRW